MTRRIVVPVSVDMLHLADVPEKAIGEIIGALVVKGAFS